MLFISVDQAGEGSKVIIITHCVSFPFKLGVILEDSLEMAIVGSSHATFHLFLLKHIVLKQQDFHNSTICTTYE